MLDGLAFSLPRTQKKEHKPIPKISKKKQKRIAENGGEKELFLEIWEERLHICEVDGMIIPEPKPECFAHRLGKGRYPEYRYVKANIGLVCANGKCHHAFDAMNKGKDIEIISSF